MNLQNKVVVITGASQGLGRQLAIQIAKLDAKVIMLARTEKLLIELKEQIVKDGGVAEYFVCDVTSPDQVNSTIDSIIEKFSQIDILINNAGLWTNDRIEVEHPERILDVFMVNSLGPIYTTKKVLPLFEKQSSGHLVYINSISGLDMAENKDWSVYASSKWALTGYTKSIAAKLSGSDIKVTSIHPGPIDSKMPDNAGDDWGKDKSWLMSPSEVAQSVIYALLAPNKIQVGQIEFKKTNWNQ